jgi:hypothetical protein
MNTARGRVLWSMLRRSGVTRLLSDHCFVKLQYRLLMGRELNLRQPRDYNEKLQWLKLNYRNPLLAQCADKYQVREFVGRRVGKRYLNEMLGLYAHAGEVDFERLPEAFVLKATHGSGWNILCPDKRRLNERLARATMKRWLSSDFSRNGREWQYRGLPRRIICEKFLRDKTSASLKDYKIFAFDGTCKYIWVDGERPVAAASPPVTAPPVSYGKPQAAPGCERYRNIYDVEWRFQPEKRILRPNSAQDVLAPPPCLGEMLDVAAALSRGFPQCRVDLYALDGRRVVFGELTFTCGNGCNDFQPPEFALEMGGYIRLPEASRGAGR